MFKTRIASTPLTTPIADTHFYNIKGSPVLEDNSFLSTLRALIAPRIKEDESIQLCFNASFYNSTTIASFSAVDAVRKMCDYCGLEEKSGYIFIHNFAGSSKENLASFRIIESEFASCYKGYHRLDKIKAFYHKSFRVDCYINPDRKNVVIFVDNLDVKKLHYLQVSILAFLPWYFDSDTGVSELEMELLYSLRETSEEKYRNCIARIAESYDFRGKKIRSALSGFESRYEETECARMRNTINVIDERIRALNDEIGVLYRTRNDSCVKLLGLERKIAEGKEDSEIMEYFLCNNKLWLDDVIDRDMIFSVKEYLSYFDREMAERAINNMRSFVYPYGERPYNHITCDDMKSLMTEIFVNEEPVLRIRFCAAYCFRLDSNVVPQGSYAFDSYEFEGYMPNPHIDAYRCMGGYEQVINQLLNRGDYIGALEQCVASCKSLNWGDSTVMSRFMRAMWGDGSSNRCIELPDGRVVNTVEAIRWLKQREV